MCLVRGSGKKITGLLRAYVILWAGSVHCLHPYEKQGKNPRDFFFFFLPSFSEVQSSPKELFFSEYAFKVKFYSFKLMNKKENGVLMGYF